MTRGKLMKSKGEIEEQCEALNNGALTRRQNFSSFNIIYDIYI